VSNEQSELFSVLELPTWLPGETLYSLCSRYHRYSANGSQWETSFQLFGVRRETIAHDIPSRLQAFEYRSRGLLGTAEEMALKHSILPFYLNFKSEDERSSILSDVCSGGLGSIKFRVGLITSRFRAHHPLKMCLKCMLEDVVVYGVPYWHVDLQYPGIWICAKHGKILAELDVKANGVSRFSWQLPVAQKFTSPVRSRISTHRMYELRKKLITIAEIVDMSMKYGLQNEWDQAKLLACYKTRLGEMGLLSDNGRFRWKEISRGFSDYVQSLREIHEFSCLPKTEAEAKTQLDRILRERGRNCHPLRKIILIAWLFGSWQSFFKTYIPVAVHARAGDTKPKAKKKDELQRLRLVELVERDAQSATEAAKNIGIDVKTAMSWLAQRGHVFKLRPKKIFGELRRIILNGLENGEEKKDIALRAGISIQAVTTIMRTECGLNERWAAAKKAKTQEASRSTWLRIRENAGEQGVNEIRLLIPSTYAWLYRNDRDWLKLNLPVRRVRARHSNVDWDCRDLDLSQKVALVGTQLAAGEKCRKIRLWQIYQKVPELRAKLDVLDRLPHTKKVILKITRETRREK